MLNQNVGDLLHTIERTELSHARTELFQTDIVSGGSVAAYIVQFTDHFITHSFWNQPLTTPTMVWPDRSQDPNNAFFDTTFALTVRYAYARARPAARADHLGIWVVSTGVAGGERP